MKNRKSIIAVSLFLAFATLTLPLAAQAGGPSGPSGGPATATAGSAANADALAIANGGKGGVGFGGAAGATASNNLQLMTGSTTAGAAINFNPSTALNFEASKVPVQATGFMGYAPGSAQLFFSNAATNPPQITGVALSRWARQACNQVATRTHRGSTEVVKGSSGDTKVRVTYYADSDKRFATDTTAPMVSFGLPGPKTPVVCLAVLTVQGKDPTVDINTVDNDAEAFALAMSGFERIWIVSPESAIGGALGVEADGRGLGLGAQGVGITGAVTTALGLSGGVNSGTTTPTTRIGSTYIILAEPQAHGASAVMSVSDFDAFHARLIGVTQSQPVGTNGATKDAAAKK